MIVATQQQISHIDDLINTIYSVITYGLPLLTAVMLAVIALFVRLRGQVQTNQQHISQLTEAANGKLDSVKSTVEAISDQVGTRRVRATDPGADAGPAPEPAGGTVPSSVAPIHPVDVQPSDGDQQPVGGSGATGG